MDRHEIRAKRRLDQVVLFAMTNLSSLFSYQSMHRAFGMAADVVQDYVGFLEEAFLLFEVSRFHPNLKVQSRDAKKIYVIDTGLRNIHARSLQDDTGKLAENVAYIELRRRRHEIYYFKDQGEVDFIITENGKPRQAIQVCYSDMTDESTFRREMDSLLNCLDQLKLECGLILTMNREEIVPVGGKTIKLIPLYKYCGGVSGIT